MPLKKAQNKTFSSEEDGVTDANIRASAPGNASSVSHKEEDATPARDLDLSQVLEMMRNGFPSKISEVLGCDSRCEERSAGLFVSLG